MTLQDVLVGLEPGDKLTYRNGYGQELQGQVVRVVDNSRVLMERPDWTRLGFGPECIQAADYELVRCCW
jgi:hypothetical protein